jgi:hypothetical protein
MSRLILTFDGSAAGALKGLADCVVAFEWRFVWGPLLPSDALERLLSPRTGDEATPHWPDNLASPFVDEARDHGLGLAEFCERFDAVELWADPEPNPQLQLVWLLDHLRSHANVVSRLALVQPDIRIGSQWPAEWMKTRLVAVPIHSDHLEIASAAWSAWRAPTPAAWFDLLARDLTALPPLRSTVLALLEELPMHATGLGATEMRMLELVAAGQMHPYDLFPGHEKPNEHRTFGYWEVGKLLDGLARCPEPAMSGLTEGPFDDALHDSKDRHARYRSSQLSLTQLGKAVLAQSDDFSRHNPIHRWWGGTELTNDRLWRWDPSDRVLIAPQR